MMETVDKDWITIQGLIGHDKAGNLAELRRRPLLKPGLERQQTFLWPRTALLPAAAAFLLTMALGIFWAALGEWHSVPSGASSDALLVGTFLYSDPRDASLPAGFPPSASPKFTAWAAMALQETAAGNEASPAADGGEATVEHGDPATMRQHLSDAIRGNVFAEFLSRYKKFHDKEA